jgi:hypothetical protein
MKKESGFILDSFFSSKQERMAQKKPEPFFVRLAAHRSNG